MYLNTLKIRNFRCFESIDLNFKDKKFVVFAGNNGAGKTAILEAIVTLMGAYFRGFPEINNNGITLNDVRMTSDIMGTGTELIKRNFPAILEGSATTQNGELLTWKREKNSLRGGTTYVHSKNISDYATNLYNQSISNITEERNRAILPVVSYQSFKRMGSQKKDDWKNKFDNDLSRNLGYRNCVSAESDIKQITKYFKKMSGSEQRLSKEICEFTAVKKAVTTFVSLLNDSDMEYVPLYDPYEEELFIRIDGTKLIPLRLMSAGYQSVISMILDIAHRMAILNPQLEKDVISETPGIIIIDELTMHAHPRWQLNLVNALKNTFKNCQIITATHSPYVLRSCKPGEVYVINNDGETFEDNTARYGWDIEDIVNDLMGVEYSEESRYLEVLQEVESAIQSNQKSEAQSSLKKLEKMIHSNNEVYSSLKLQVTLLEDRDD